MPKHRGSENGRKATLPYIGWKPIEDASFGLIYGAIMVLSILMALGHQIDAPFRPTVVLFGSMLAITLARAFATLVSHAIETGQRMLRLPALRAAWRGNYSVLMVATVPATLFIAAGLGWMELAAAVSFSQLFCILILVVLGARVGWLIGRGPWLPLGGAVFAGSIGAALAALKYALQ